MEEIWKDIKGYEGLYQVSNLGRVRSLDRLVNQRYGKRICKGSVLRLNEHKNGYLMISLHKEQAVKNCEVHRLVATAFIGDPQEMDVDHIDFNKHNNRVDNLQIITRRENIVRSKHYCKVCKGGDHPKSKPIKCCVDGVSYIAAGSIRDLSELLGIGYRTLKTRLYRGGFNLNNKRYSYATRS